jgi:hypothetical protein
VNLQQFYSTTAQACFTILSVWWVFLGLNFQRWVKDRYRRLMLYDVSLYFLLPGLMSLVLGTAGIELRPLEVEGILIAGLLIVGFSLAWLMFLATAEKAADAQEVGDAEDRPTVALDRRPPRGRLRPGAIGPWAHPSDESGSPLDSHRRGRSGQTSHRPDRCSDSRLRAARGACRRAP